MSCVERYKISEPVYVRISIQIFLYKLEYVGVVRLNERVYIYAAPSFYGPWLWRESEESAPHAVQQQDLLRREELLSFLHAVVQHRER